MIIKQHYMTRSDGVELVINFSDQGLQILGENGAVYYSAVDPAEINRNYTETRFMAGEFTMQVEYWLQLIREGTAVIDDVPEAFRDLVQRKIGEEETEF